MLHVLFARHKLEEVIAIEDSDEDPIGIKFSLYLQKYSRSYIEKFTENINISIKHIIIILHDIILYIILYDTVCCGCIEDSNLCFSIAEFICPNMHGEQNQVQQKEAMQPSLFGK